LYSQHAGEIELLDTVVVIPYAKGVVIASGIRAAPTDAAADGPFNRVGFFIGEVKAYEKANAFLIRFAVEEVVDGPIARLFGVEVLSCAPVDCPRALLFRDDQSLTGLSTNRLLSLAKVCMMAKPVLEVRLGAPESAFVEVIEAGGCG
jgi:hypothetical protein